MGLGTLIDSVGAVPVLGAAVGAPRASHRGEHLGRRKGMVASDQRWTAEKGIRSDRRGRSLPRNAWPGRVRPPSRHSHACFAYFAHT